MDVKFKLKAHLIWYKSLQWATLCVIVDFVISLINIIQVKQCEQVQKQELDTVIINHLTYGPS